MSKPSIIWSNQAKDTLKSIFKYYKTKSVQAANKIKGELLSCPKHILFSKQYQLDDINSNYRRIIIRDYKVLYKEVEGNIQIIDIVGTRQSPEKLKRK